MPNYEEMAALNDAYNDIREVIAPFISPSWDNLFEGLSDEDAQAGYKPLYNELAEDGYTHKEICFLTAMAVHGVQKEMIEDIEDYEAES